MNCKHGLPPFICMKCDPHDVGELHYTKMGGHEDFPDADMDNIEAHECQHKSDVRICPECKFITEAVRHMTWEPRTLEEWLLEQTIGDVE